MARIVFRRALCYRYSLQMWEIMGQWNLKNGVQGKIEQRGYLRFGRYTASAVTHADAIAV